MRSKDIKKAKKMLRKEKIKLLKEAGKNRHHIIPSSRGGGNNQNNIIYIDVIKHDIYHQLFRNKTPDEIINYLIDYFWNGQEKWVFEAIAKREE